MVLHPRRVIGAAMALKELVERNLEDRKSVALVSLGVKRAFDAAWWPTILNALGQFECPKNLYNLSSYLVTEQQHCRPTTS